MDYLIWGVIVLALLTFLHVVMRFLHYRQLTNEIRAFFESRQMNYQLTCQRRRPYDWYIETVDRIILCKLYHIGRQENIVITNPTTWIRTKKSDPIKIENRLLGVKAFIEAGQRIKNEKQKPVDLLAIFHPGPSQIRQFINENEMIIVNLHQKVYQYIFTATDRLQEGLIQILNEK
ncbi:MAG TPA: hypothetical protein VIK63_07725 [Haloplasmataceae bacterium]